MKNILKLLVFAVAVFALPALAGSPPNGSKFFTLTMSASGNVVTATLMNTSPPNTSGATTSSIGSVDLSVDLGWLFDPSTITVQGKPYKTKASQQPAGHIKVVTPSPIKPGTNLVITFQVANSSGDGTFNALVYTGSSFNGNQFAPDPTTPSQNIASVATASLSCGGSQGSSIAPGTIVAKRGAWNKDGTVSGDPCNPVNYYASDTLGNNVGLPPNVVHFRWDESGTDERFSTASFQYSIFYATAPSTVRVGWLHQDKTLAVDAGANPNANSSNPVVFIDAPPCLAVADQVPTPYGTLTQTMQASDDVLYIDTTGATLSPPAVVPADGFSIYVGLERMLVTGYNEDGSWNVLRGQLGTTAAEHDVVGDVGPLVMSTPLPSLGDTAPAAYVLLANGTFTPAGTNPYLANTQAQICLEATGTSGGFPFIQVIDIGDGWVPVR